MRLFLSCVACSCLLACGAGELTAFTSEPSLGEGGVEGGPIDTTGNGGAQVFTTELIDDFEDGDTRVAETSESWWYIFNDSTGEQQFSVENVSGQRGDSTYAARTYGEQFTAWGAGLGVNLTGIQDARNPAEPFDASRFAGVSFWAKVEAPSVREIKLDFLSDCGDNCVSYSGVNIVLEAEWRQYTVLFSELIPRQDDTQFDPSQVTHIQFFFLGPVSFDLWVDDLAVVSRYIIK